MHERPPITAETTWFAARDGRLLTGTFYAPGAPSASNGRSVLVSGALGVPRGFYERYARFLASDGFTVLTYDYRGIGDSRKPPAEADGASLRDWGEADLPGALDHLAARAPSHRLLAVAHSVGGQLFGLAHNNGRAAALLSICCPSGYWRLWPWPHRLWLAPLWFCVVPALGGVLSHLPVRRAGLGFAADLPAGVMREWARWCRHADYLVDDEGHPLREHFRATAPDSRIHGQRRLDGAARRGAGAASVLFDRAGRASRDRAGSAAARDRPLRLFPRRQSRAVAARRGVAARAVSGRSRSRGCAYRVNSAHAVQPVKN